MEVLNLPVSQTFNDMLLPLIVFIVISSFISWKFDFGFGTLKLNNLIAVMKVVFYLLIAGLALFLNVQIINDSMKISFHLKESLSVGEYLVVIVSVLEFVSNLISLCDSTELKKELAIKREIESLKMQIEQLEKFNKNN